MSKQRSRPSGQSSSSPSALTEAEKERFEILRQALRHNALALVRSRRKSNGEEVALLCDMSFDTQEQRWHMQPLAELLGEDPCDDYEKP